MTRPLIEDSLSGTSGQAEFILLRKKERGGEGGGGGGEKEGEE